MAIYASTSNLKGHTLALTKRFPVSLRRGGSPRPLTGWQWPRAVPTQFR